MSDKSGATGDKPVPDISELQAGIARTRHDLAQTVEALSAKLDVKSQAKAKVDRTRDNLVAQATATWQEQKPALAAAGAAALTVLALRRRRRRRKASASKRRRR